MNIKTTILMAGFFTLATTTAQATSSLNEVLSGIDGEYNHLQDDARVNFDLSASGSSQRVLNSVLSGVDGEYDYSNESNSRVNYSIDASQSDDQILNDVLSGIDGEY